METNTFSNVNDITEKDWIVIDNVKYDVTSFKHKHPGGVEVLDSYNHLDATDVFNEFHSKNAKKFLKSLPIIENYVETSVSSFDKDMRNLHDELVNEGCFQANILYYTRKILELFGLLIVTCYILHYRYIVISAFFFALFLQQSGWLAHDIAHDQVSKKLRPILLLFTGNLFQGFSGKWWIPKHMVHHARPNALHETNRTPVDTDFDTAPFIYWVSCLIPTNNNFWKSLWLKYQGYFVWMLLFASKLSWDYYCCKTVLEKMVYKELFGIIVHHTVVLLYPIIQTSSIVHGVMFYILGRLMAGFLIGFVFIQSHNGMEYYNRHKLSFYEAQIKTTRNISPTKWVTWFTGGLNYQIEHHMFPRMPRHNLPYVADKIRSICKKHGFEYISIGFYKSCYCITKHLKNVSISICKEKLE